MEGQGVSDETLKLKYWGWDYGHVDDYCTWMSDITCGDIELFHWEECIKYTVDEIYENDVVPFIDLLEEKFPGSTETKEEKLSD